jgi:hypothetical protein
MKTNYEVVRGIFIQKGLVDAMTTNIKFSNYDLLLKGEFSYWCWRYVFMKDITKKALTSRLLKWGFDNLTIVEIFSTLNTTKELVGNILDDYKKEVK